MTENIHPRSGAAGSGQSHMASPRRRPAGLRPSARSVNGLLEWIQQAQTVNWAWVRNFLAVLGLLLAVLLLASGLGFLPR